MSISFACEFCSRKYRVDDGLAGRKVKCKECGTDLTVPSPRMSAAAATSKAPAKDLYGLDDEDEIESAPPPPRRPGMQAESSSSSRSRGSSRGAAGHVGFQKAGTTLLVLGGLSFVLPFVGLQVKGLHLMSPQAQVVGGVLMIVAGAFCLMASSTGFLKSLAFTVLGAVVGVPVLCLVAAALLPENPGAAQGNGNGNAGLGPNGPGPNFNPNPAMPNFGGNAPGPADADLGRVAITGGRAMTGTGPAGIGMMGVSFEIDYRVESRGMGVPMYDLIVKSSKGRSKIVPPVHLRDSGTVSVTVPTMSQSDGPFEICFEAESFGVGGMARKQVSDLVGVAWTQAPQQQFQQPQPPPFGPGGFPNNNNPAMPPNMPGQPGYRPPGMPQMPNMPGRRMPFGPRGRP